MKSEFRMPSLGADMDHGTLVEWLVHPGQQVRRGDVVAVVDTAKANVEVECFTSGVVDQLLVEPGVRVPVGAVLATITTGGPEPEPAPAAPQPAPTAPATAAVRSPVTSPLVRRLADAAHVDLGTVHGTGPGGRVTHADVRAASSTTERTPAAVAAVRIRSSPLARKLAQELGVPLTGIAGSGPGGAVRAADVTATAAALTAAPAPAETADRTMAIRAQIATSMARAKREIPHYYLAQTIDLEAALRRLREHNRTVPVAERVLPAALLLKAAAMAVSTVPDLNGFHTGTAFHRSAAVHLGVAISLREGGLVAPAIHDADKLTVPELMAALKDLVARTRAGRLRAAELADPTITVSSLGEQGVDTIHGVIYPPQVALVGFGAIRDRPCAVDGLLGVHPTVTASLAADHRVTDGISGARYLLAVERLLNQPDKLL
ncbi:dihydrolipoamide acetyltransferase family protein [Catellatospora coxensis]|uniref:Dihydrolipoamide acetyltransferase component of pyruvate dehydrogenase complex n=1 Tax=Catellatospora coxensis TaxID=310354 RepID=A0A8J3P7D4_9ACTN|nr:dihydrolipoamide acetyltransferase family protein [Catellatospora coxensis]GIG06497.1 dihydrolipoamide acetyltransferase component of pyruvate dehydrogenase complex [Catellatospora coxensis]